MVEHILKALLSQGTSALGAVTRTWLCVTVPLWVAIGGSIALWGAQPFADRMAASVCVGFVAAVALSIPVMAAVAIVHVARKW